MKVGDYIDPSTSGNEVIDIKTMMSKFGYVTGQVSVDAIKKIPPEVQKEIDDILVKQATIVRLSGIKRFKCPSCGEENVSNWRKDAENEFLICGACNKVVEVR